MTLPRRIFAFAVIAIAALGCAVAVAVAAPTSSTKVTKWWSVQSPFNQTLDGAGIDARSGAWAQMLYDSAGQAGLWVNDDAWTTPVYHATPSTPRITIAVVNTQKSITIPYDPSWRPSPDGDSHIAIIDPKAGCDYEFQSFDPARHAAIAEGTYRIYSGSGAHVPTGHTGAALSLLAGLIRPADVRLGVIRHALAFAAPVTAPAAVAPASWSDGRNPTGIPEGTRFQLDPSLDLSPWHLSPFQLMVARALQRYGMYLRDTGGAVALYAESRTDGASYALPIQGLPRDLLLHMRAMTPPHNVSFDSQNPARCARQH
jgi:hypothetical protein